MTGIPAELQLLLAIVETGGGTGAIVIMAYFLWRIDRNLFGFTEAFKASMTHRDKKLDDIHNDVKGEQK